MTTGLVVTDREKAIDFIEKLIKDYHDKGYNKALEDVGKKLICAWGTLENNFAHMVQHGRVPKKYLEDNERLKADIKSRFDEVGLIYSDIFDISYNVAVTKLKEEVRRK